MMMAVMIGLCAAVSTFCAVMLMRGFVRKRVGRLFWVAMCFVGLAVENWILFVDLVVMPAGPDLSPYRFFAALVGVACLTFSFWEKAVE